MIHAGPVQTPPADRSASGGPRPAGRGPARLAAGTAAALVPVIAPIAPAAPAGAQDYAYTGSCSVSVKAPGELEATTRSFRARVPRTRDGNRWNLGGYDYWYQVSPTTTWGPHSDEELTIIHGRIDGPSPWHSPDEHTSNVAWVAERGWKGVSSAGASQVKFHAWFDIPRMNDPECNVYTATF